MRAKKERGPSVIIISCHVDTVQLLKKKEKTSLFGDVSIGSIILILLCVSR